MFKSDKFECVLVYVSRMFCVCECVSGAWSVLIPVGWMVESLKRCTFSDVTCSRFVLVACVIVGAACEG